MEMSSNMDSHLVSQPPMRLSGEDASMLTMDRLSGEEQWTTVEMLVRGRRFDPWALQLHSYRFAAEVA